MDFVVQSGGELLLSILGGIISFLIDKKTGSSRQLLRVLRENRSSFCISSKRVVPVKYSREKDSVNGGSHSKPSKRETCVNLF